MPLRALHPGDVIPPEWVGLATPPRAVSSVIASRADASLQFVTSAPAWGERGACVVEPGKPCTSSGRCRRLGH
ncbi:MAG: hypothetical protein HY049_07385 [Acidobacteria bacterium]|nr:hypothetical protein [Acidobacteriota bacterium]